MGATLRTRLFFLTLFISLVSGQLLVWAAVGEAPDPIDPSNRIVRLDGQWEFYWHRLLLPSDFAAPGFNLEPRYLSVPGGWKNSVVDGVTLGGEGYGTYRLRVVLAPEVAERETLALYIPYVRTSHRLFVNGRLVAERGVVGVDRETSAPAAGTEVVSVPGFVWRGEADGGHPELEIVLHVSNFFFREGGLARSLLLGTEEDIRTFTQRSLTFEMFLAVSLLVVGLYHLGMWFIRPRDRHFLFFALFCLLIALRNSVMDQAPLTLFVPNIPWELLLKIEYIGYYLGIPIVVLFLHEMYPLEYDKRLVAAAVAVGALFSAFVAVMPGRINSHALVYYHIVTALLLAFIVRGLVLANRNKRVGARVILAAAAVVAIVVIHDILFYWGTLGTRGLAPLSVLGMVGAYSFVLSKKFSDEFEYQRLLTEENRNLLRRVNEQIIQIKDTRRLMTEREERTRREVAEMLHGSVQSRLLSAQHHLRKSLGTLAPLHPVPDDIRSDLEAAVHSVRQAREQIAAVNEQEIRQLSHLLHPMLLRIGLVPALRSLVERFSDQLHVELRIVPELEDASLDGDVGITEEIRLAMYRIVEEALTNVLKHSGAKRVEVVLKVIRTPTGRLLSGVVADDGVGSGGQGPVTERSGFGMRMIAARIEEVGGGWSVDESSGRGTTLRVQLPLPGRTGGDGSDWEHQNERRGGGHGSPGEKPHRGLATK